MHYKDEGLLLRIPDTLSDEEMKTVQIFFETMLLKLGANGSKRSFDLITVRQSISRLHEELEEAQAEIDAKAILPTVLELADVANFALLGAAAALRLDFDSVEVEPRAVERQKPEGSLSNPQGLAVGDHVDMGVHKGKGRVTAVSDTGFIDVVIDGNIASSRFEVIHASLIPKITSEDMVANGCEVIARVQGAKSVYGIVQGSHGALVTVVPIGQTGTTDFHYSKLEVL